MSSDQTERRRILLGVCGGVSAFKAILLVRRLQDAGFEVRVVMTDAATRFIGVPTFHAISQNPVHRSVWALDESSAGELHVDLSRWADAIVVYPATANLVGGLSAGLADDLLKLCICCFDGPVLVSPAMHSKMAGHPLHHQALERLNASGITVVPSESGRLASGESGQGRLPEPEVIVAEVERMLQSNDLSDSKLLISAGPTREALDPVRFLTNRSSGKMGFALAEEALARGAEVTLVSGPVALSTPRGARRIDVESAEQMAAAIKSTLPGMDALIMAAAVADFRPQNIASHKLKKGDRNAANLELKRCPDILAEVVPEARPRVVVGFAMETSELLSGASAKLEAKNLDLIVANDLSQAGAGFAVDTNAVTILDRDGGADELPLMSKRAVAGRVLDRVVALLTALLLLLLPACGGEDNDDNGPTWPPSVAGPLQAGVAGGTLDLPVGVPLGGYTDRDRALGNEPGPDARNSDYRVDFVPSAGWQTRIPADVLWLENGQETAVLVRFGLIYSFDGLTEAIGQRLSERIGRDLSDSVFTMANHSHSSYGPFTKAFVLFFGGDFFNQEIFDRLVSQLVELAVQAWETRQDAAIGIGINPQFDPIGEDRLFGDRRTENDHLPGPDGSPTGAGWKDPQATLLRVDGVDGSPIAALFSFGIHGTIMGGSNALISSEAPDHISALLNERHGGPRWMFAQGAAGDVAPRGQFEGFARMESIAETAAQGILELYEATEVRGGEIQLEPAQRYVEQGRDIRVTRAGSADLHYLPWDPAWAEDPYVPDMLIWNDDGSVRSPLDEFWAQHGALLCGEPEIDISLFGLNVPLPAYQSCLDVDKSFSLFRIAFRAFISDREQYPLPLPESRTAMLGALGLRSLPVTVMGQGSAEEDVVLAFAPGEVTTLWAQNLRYRALHEAEVHRTVVLGYAMDHEGYLLTVEDWLQGGFEPAITWWGPLQGEHLLERQLELVALANSPLAEDPAWPDYPTSTWYPEWEQTPVVPDQTANAGQALSDVPDYLFTWDGAAPEQAQPEAQIARIQGMARFSFEGGDPSLGLLSVQLEQEQDDGSWQLLRTPQGNAISDALADIIVTYTPNPLSGTDVEPDPERRHYYHAQWQPLNTWAGLDQLATLPTTRYRFLVNGPSKDPADDNYPYDTISYELRSEAFEVVPAQVELELAVEGDSLQIQAAYTAAAQGYRLLHAQSAPTTPTPLVVSGKGLQVSAAAVTGGEAVALGITEQSETSSGTLVQVSIAQLLEQGSQNWQISIDDGAGNIGLANLELP